MARVFISYSHDSPKHRENVLALAKQLLVAGHHVTLDRFIAHPDPNWPQWMARELIAAEVVLCICTPTYRQRFEGTATGGFGVAWEGHLIATELYRMKGRPGRFIPVEVEADAVPPTLRGLPAVAFDAVVSHLGGIIGPPVDEPDVHPGWTEAMSVGALVGPIWKPLRPPRSTEGYAPTQLLRAEHAVVPFLGRAQQVRDLRSGVAAVACESASSMAPEVLGKHGFRWRSRRNGAARGGVPVRSRCGAMPTRRWSTWTRSSATSSRCS